MRAVSPTTYGTYVATEANHCESKKKQKALDAVHGRIQRLLQTHTDDVDEAKPHALAEASAAGIGGETTASYTARQGQYLAFIHLYTKLNGEPPAEADMRRHFKVSPPAVHDMIVMLEKKGFISRSPGVARSLRVRLSKEQLPELV